MNEIARLNDRARTGQDPVKLVMTRGVQGLGAGFVSAVMQMVRTFADFNEGNDPHKEHDFGSVSVDGRTFFFKFDYYDNDLRYGSENPADPKLTRRVLTVMLAEED